MSGNPETLTNAAGVVVFEGTTSEGGGSQPVSVFTVTAAQVAAVIDLADDFAAVELAGFSEAAAIVNTAFDDAASPGLDSGAFGGLYGYTPSATSADVYLNGLSMGTTSSGWDSSQPVSGASYAEPGGGAQFNVNVVNSGGAVYAIFSGFTGTPPTTGSVTFRVLRFG